MRMGLRWGTGCLETRTKHMLIHTAINACVYNTENSGVRVTTDSRVDCLKHIHTSPRMDIKGHLIRGYDLGTQTNEELELSAVRMSDYSFFSPFGQSLN